MKADEKNNTVDPRFAEIGKIEKKEYDKLKRRAIRFEAKNRQCVLVIPCDGESGWCEMSEISALIYKYMVCAPMGVPVNMTDDYDSFYLQYKIGRIRTRGYDTVRARLQKAGLYRDETTKDKCVVFRLKTPLTVAEIDQLKVDENTRQLAINSIARVTFADPSLYQKMIELATRLHRVCFRRMDKLASATNGKRIVETMDETIRLYYRIAESGKSKPEELLPYYREMKQLIHDLLIELQMVASMKLWTRDICMSLGESAIEIEKMIDGRIKNATTRINQRGSKSA